MNASHIHASNPTPPAMPSGHGDVQFDAGLHPAARLSLWDSYRSIGARLYERQGYQNFSR